MLLPKTEHLGTRKETSVAGMKCKGGGASGGEVRPGSGWGGRRELPEFPGHCQHFGFYFGHFKV